MQDNKKYSPMMYFKVMNIIQYVLLKNKYTFYILVMCTIIGHIMRDFKKFFPMIYSSKINVC